MRLWFYDFMMELCWKLEDVVDFIGKKIGKDWNSLYKFYPSAKWENLYLAEEYKTYKQKIKKELDLSKTEQRLKDLGHID